MASDRHLPYALPPMVRAAGIVLLIVGAGILLMMISTVSFFGYSEDVNLLNKLWFFFVAVTISGGIIIVLDNMTVASNLDQRKM